MIVRRSLLASVFWFPLAGCVDTSDAAPNILLDPDVAAVVDAVVRGDD